MNIVDFFKNLLNSLVGTSLERMKLINTMNQTFKDSYCSGALDRFCKVSITVGDTNYAHEMSAFFLRSGFKISIENDNNIKDSEFRDISQYILSNKPFIRQLMTLEFEYQYDNHNNWVECKEYHDGNYVNLHLCQYKYK